MFRIPRGFKLFIGLCLSLTAINMALLLSTSSTYSNYAATGTIGGNRASIKRGAISRAMRGGSDGGEYVPTEPHHDAPSGEEAARPALSGDTFSSGPQQYNIAVNQRHGVEGIRVDFSEEDLSTVRKGKVFLSKGNSHYAARTATMYVPRPVVGRAGEGERGIGLTFLILGDWGGAGKGPQQEVANAMDAYATAAEGHGGGVRSPLYPRHYYPSLPTVCRESVAEGSAGNKGIARRALVLHPTDYPYLYTDELVRGMLSVYGLGRGDAGSDMPPSLTAGAPRDGISPSRGEVGSAAASHFRSSLQAHMQRALRANATMARLLMGRLMGADGGGHGGKHPHITRGSKRTTAAGGGSEFSEEATVQEVDAFIEGFTLCNHTASASALSSSPGIHHSRVDFIVSTGDNMYEAGVASARDLRFRRNYEQVYHHSSLQCPWLMCLGNHDHGAHGTLRDVQAQVNYTVLSHRWYMPSTFYSQRIEGEGRGGVSLELFFVDTYEVSPSLTRVTDGQMRWLNASLGASTATWRIIVGHRPIYSAGDKHGSSPYMFNRLHPMMVQHKVAAYVCGDDHELQVLRDTSGGAWTPSEPSSSGGGDSLLGGRFVPSISSASPSHDGSQRTLPSSSAYNALYLLSGGGSRASNDGRLKKRGVKGRTVFQAGRHGFMAVRLVGDHRLSLSVMDSTGKELYAANFTNPNA